MKTLRRAGSLAALLILCTPSCGPGSEDDPDAGTSGDASPGDASSDASADAGDAQATPDAEVGPPPSCETEAPTACEQPAPGYADDVEAVLEEHCLGCHWGEPGGPWPLDSYSHVVAWTMEIRATMLSCSMPPADADQPAMPLEDRQLLLRWLRCDAPE